MMKKIISILLILTIVACTTTNTTTQSEPKTDFNSIINAFKAVILPN